MSYINNIVDAQHVSTTNADLIRAIRRCFHTHAFMRINRRMRHRVYREAIKRHRRNQGLFMAVALGDFKRRQS
jgi:hypothetical protein